MCFHSMYNMIDILSTVSAKIHIFVVLLLILNPHETLSTIDFYFSLYNVVIIVT